MTDKKTRVEQALEHIREAMILIEQNKNDINLEVDYMKGYSRDSEDFRKLSEHYECHEGAVEGLQKAVFNLSDIIW